MNLGLNLGLGGSRPSGAAGPTILLSASSVLESAGVGSTVGVLSVSGSTGWTFTKTADPDNKFVISGANLNLAAALDFETAESHSVTVQAAKAGEDTISRTFTITVENVFEQPDLVALGGTFTLAEDAAQGDSAGTITGKTSGSTLSLIDNAGGRVQLSGTTVQAGPTALDFEAATSHTFTVRETLADSANSPRDTVLTLTVTNVFEQPDLGALSLDDTQVPVDEAATINILGATSGSTITGSVPDGLTLNSAARTITGTPTVAGVYTFNLVETLADSSNSPRTTSVTLEVVGVSSYSPLSLFAAGEQGVWYDPSDFSTMYQDNLGVTPVTAVGQSVGFLGDKSKGFALGAERVTNGTFDGSTSWIDQLGGLTFVDGKCKFTLGTTQVAYQQLIGTVAGRFYEITLDVSDFSSGNLNSQLSSSGTTAGTAGVSFNSNGTKRNIIVAPTNDCFIRLRGENAVLSVDNISVRELPGNHATQSTLAQRPILAREPVGGRRNLLLATDTMATQSRTVTAVAHTLSFTGTGTVTLSGASTAGPLVGTGASDRVSLTFTPSAASLTLTVSGSVTFAQLETGSTATAYQRVVTAFDVTEAGVQDLYYLAFDGSDDWLATGNINFSATDEMTVCAGVRKLSNAAEGLVAELGPSAFTTNGTWAVFAPLLTDGRYYVRSRGTVLSFSNTGAVSAPDTSVLSALLEISADTNILRRNGAQVNSSTADQGEGNFAAAQPIYIGRQNGSSRPLNGHLFSLVVRGNTTSGADLTNVETFTAEKTGIVI
jgi:hypothetical protein